MTQIIVHGSGSSANLALLNYVENRNRRYQLKAFIHWLEDRRWFDVDLRDYRKHLMTQNLAPSTVNKYLEAVYVLMQDLASQNEVRDYFEAVYEGLPEGHSKRKKYTLKEFVDEEVTRLLNNANPKRLRVDEKTVMHEADSQVQRLTLAEGLALVKAMPSVRDRAVGGLLLSTGLRVEEAHLLNVGDLYQSREEMPAVAVWRGKGNKQRLVLYVDEMEPFFAYVDTYLDTYGLSEDAPLFQGYRSRHNERLNGRRLSVRSMQQMVENAPAPRPITAHSLRHSYARILRVECGYSVKFVQEQLGHDNERTTEHYIGAHDPRALELAGRI